MEDWGWLADVPYIGGAMALLAGVAAAVRKAWPLVRKISHFVDDWFGESARPGTAGVPGVLTRLAAIESRLARVEGQFSPNGGGSLRDAVNRVEAAVTDQEGHN